VTRHSPCIGICKLDDTTGYCLGCGRTGGEIGDWIAMSEAQRDAVWQKLPARLSTLSARVRLLPWTRDELVNWVRDTIATRQGTWVVGDAGEFPGSTGSELSLHAEPGSIVARARDASFRLRVNEKVRAFAFNAGGPIVLGLPKGRAVLRSFATLQPLGADADAIDEDRSSEQLFDLGLGRQNNRLCVRTNDPSLLSILSAHTGQQWPDVRTLIGKELIAANPIFIAESAAARVEFLLNGVLPAFPEFPKASEGTSVSLDLPDYAAPVAIFYPKEIRN